MVTKQVVSISIDASLREKLKLTIPFSNFVEAAIRLALTWDAQKWQNFTDKYLPPKKNTSA